jgi:hypothetical protein
MTKEAKLGDKVKDIVTGFKGVVVSAHNYLNGCTRLTVQPKLGKDGKMPDTETFDAPQLKIITQEAHSIGNTITGGPSKFEDKGR